MRFCLVKHGTAMKESQEVRCHIGYCGLQTPDNSMATSSHPPASASRVASVTPQSTTPTVTSSECNSDGGNEAGRSAPARLALPHSARRRPQPSAPVSADQSMAGEESR